MKRLKLFIILLLILVSKSAISANPQQFNVCIQNASQALASGNYEAAVISYKRALQLYPNQSQIYNNLGIVYSRMHDLNNAELSYKKAIQLDPSNPSAYSNLSNIYITEQKYSEAAKYLEQYAKLAPRDKNVYNNLCWLYNKAGNKDLCIKYGEKYIQFSDDKFDTYSYMGDVCKKFEDYNKAVYFYNKALSVLNNNAASNNTYNESRDNNIQYVLQELRICRFNARIANLYPSVNAPQALYNLIKQDTALKNPQTSAKLREMLDLLWVDDNGRILLSEVIKYKIPIKIIPGGTGQTNALIQTEYRKTPLYYTRYVPMPIVVAIPMSIAFAIFHPDYKKENHATINMGDNIIQLYKNPNSSLEDNMYALMSVMHEAGHAVSSYLNEKKSDSIEEEMAVSMIGLNSASKIFFDRPLTREESIEYAENTYKSLMSDDHKTLPLYNDFRSTISPLGLNLYNYDTYSDLNRLQQKAFNGGGYK